MDSRISAEKAKMQCVATLSGHSDRVWSVSWGDDGDTLVSCGGDKSIRVWKPLQTGSPFLLHDAHAKTVRCVSWRPTFGSRPQSFAAASFDGTTSLWESVGKGKDWICAATLEGHENEVKCAAWDEQGALLATCGRDKTVWVWGCSETDRDEFECVAVLRGHAGDVKRVRFGFGSGKGARLYSSSYDGSVREWGPGSGSGEEEWSCLETLDGHSGTVWDVDVERSSGRLVTCSADSTAMVWAREEEKWKAVSCVTGVHGDQPLYSVAWGSGAMQGKFAVAGGDDSVRVFSDTGAQVLAVTRAHGADVNCVTWNPRHPNLLASCGDDRLIKVWDVAAK